MHTNNTANIHSNVTRPLRSANSNQPAIKTSLDLSVNPNSGLMPFVGMPNNLNPRVQREGNAKKLNLLA
jgi:hypothetical protein